MPLLIETALYGQRSVTRLSELDDTLVDRLETYPNEDDGGTNRHEPI